MCDETHPLLGQPVERRLEVRIGSSLVAEGELDEPEHAYVHDQGVLELGIASQAASELS